MECWYDTLFECDCKGIDEIASVPCAGSLAAWPLTRASWGQMTEWAMIVPTRLARRVEYISNCSDLCMGTLYFFDNYKTGKCDIFMQVTHGYRRFEIAGQKLFVVYRLDPYHCYYLGRWMWYWSRKLQKPFPPITYQRPLDFTFTWQPYLPYRDMFQTEGVSRDMLEIFWGKDDSDQYFAQLSAIQKRKQMIKD